jgi:hypothetical protein
MAALSQPRLRSDGIFRESTAVYLAEISPSLVDLSYPPRCDPHRIDPHGPSGIKTGIGPGQINAADKERTT